MADLPDLTALPGLDEAFGQAIADAVAADLAAHPADGALVRLVLRWHEVGDPAYFTVHALGTAEADAATGEWMTWYPLEWPNADREFDRTDRITNDPTVIAAADALVGVRGPLVEAQLDAEEAGEALPGPVDEHPPSLVGAVRALPAALQAAGVEVDPSLAVTAAMFEGPGWREVLELTATPEQLAALEAAGLLDEETDEA